MYSVELTPTVEECKGPKNLFRIKVPGMIDKSPSVSKGTRIVVYKGDYSYLMTVFKVAGTNVFLSGPSDEQKFIEEVSYSIN